MRSRSLPFVLWGLVILLVLSTSSRGLLGVPALQAVFAIALVVGAAVFLLANRERRQRPEEDQADGSSHAPDGYVAAGVGVSVFTGLSYGSNLGNAGDGAAFIMLLASPFIGFFVGRITGLGGVSTFLVLLGVVLGVMWLASQPLDSENGEELAPIAIAVFSPLVLALFGFSAAWGRARHLRFAPSSSYAVTHDEHGNPFLQGDE